MPLWLTIAFLVISIGSMILRRRPKAVVPGFERPRVKEGQSIPVVFGVCELGPNITWYGDLEETKRGDYHAYRGRMLGVLSLGPLDQLIDIRFGDYSIRAAPSTKDHRPVLSETLPYTRPVGGAHLELFVQAPDLYGGEKQQGGPVGLIHLHWGELDDVICELTRLAFGDARASAYPGQAYVAIGYVPEPEGQDVFDEADWTLVEDYGGDFSFNGTNAVMNGLWSVGIGGGNGVLEIQHTRTGLDPDETYTISIRARHTQGTFNDFWSIRLLPGALSVQIAQQFYNGALGGIQTLMVRAKPSAAGELGVAFGASGIEFADPNYEMIITRFNLGAGDAEENYAGPYWVPKVSVGGPGLRQPDPSEGLFEFGMNNPVPPDMTFIVQRTAMGVTNEHVGLGSNPADMIYEVATSPTFGLGKPDSLLDMVEFAASGATLADEDVGLHVLMSADREAEDWIEDWLSAVDGFAFTDPETGLFRFRLARDDYDVEDCLVVTKKNARHIVVERPDLASLTSEVKVRYRRLEGVTRGSVVGEPLGKFIKKGWFYRYQCLGRNIDNIAVMQGMTLLVPDVDYKVDPVRGVFWFPGDGDATDGAPATVSYTSEPTFTGFTDAVQPARNLATQQAQGTAARSEIIELPMLGTDPLAQRAASRFLKAESRKLAQVRFDVNKQGGLLRPGDVVVLTDADAGADELLVRVLTANYGTIESPWAAITGIEDRFADDTPLSLPGAEGEDFIDGQRQAPRPAGLEALDPSSITLALFSADTAFDFELKIADDEDETNATTVEIDGDEVTYEDAQTAGTTKSYWLRHIGVGYLPSEWIGPVTYTAAVGTVPAPAEVMPTVTEVPSVVGSVAALELEIEDPQNRVQLPVEFWVKAGAAGELATQVSAEPFEVEVDLVAGLQSHIRYRVTYIDADGEEATIENTVLFGTHPGAAEVVLAAAHGSFPDGRVLVPGVGTAINTTTPGEIAVDLDPESVGEVALQQLPVEWTVYSAAAQKRARIAAVPAAEAEVDPEWRDWWVLDGFTQGRLVVEIVDPAPLGTIGKVIYSLNNGVSFADLGVEIPLHLAGTRKSDAWANLAALAMGDVLLSFATEGGDGATDCRLASIRVQFAAFADSVDPPPSSDTTFDETDLAYYYESFTGVTLAGSNATAVENQAGPSDLSSAGVLVENDATLGVDVFRFASGTHFSLPSGTHAARAAGHMFMLARFDSQIAAPSGSGIWTYGPTHERYKSDVAGAADFSYGRPDTVFPQIDSFDITEWHLIEIEAGTDYWAMRVTKGGITTEIFLDEDPMTPDWNSGAIEIGRSSGLNINGFYRMAVVGEFLGRQGAANAEAFRQRMRDLFPLANL